MLANKFRKVLDKSTNLKLSAVSGPNIDVHSIYLYHKQREIPQ